MGYNTTYMLTFPTRTPRKEDTREVLAAVVERLHDAVVLTAPGYWFLSEPEESGVYGSDYYFEEDMPWYDWLDDLAEVSRQIPGVLFSLEGHGDSWDDLWKAYFLSGLVQYEKLQVEFAALQPEKMKPVMQLREEWGMDN